MGEPPIVGRFVIVDLKDRVEILLSALNGLAGRLEVVVISSGYAQFLKGLEADEPTRTETRRSKAELPTLYFVGGRIDKAGFSKDWSGTDVSGSADHIAKKLSELRRPFYRITTMRDRDFGPQGCGLGIISPRHKGKLRDAVMRFFFEAQAVAE